MTANRTCQTCSLCCKVLSITELNKPVGQWCQHVRKRAGCSIHGAHPAECRDFSCLWLSEQSIDDIWNPLKSKMVLVADHNRVTAHVDPGWPGSWRNEPYYSDLKQMAWNAIDAAGQVCVSVNNRIIVILPDKDIELGKFEPGDHIIVAETPHGWEAYKLPIDQIKPEDRGKWLHVSKTGRREEL